jgi:hypothetical protein
MNIARPKRRSERQLHVESLENRNLLAGNVNAFVSAGDLVVVGDNFGNNITIESAGANRVQVRGFTDANGLPTSVNGTPNGLIFFEGVTRDIIVNMQGGNDLVRITNLVTPRHLLVDMGAQSDQLLTGVTTVGQNAQFGNTPSGQLFVQGDFRMNGGDGNDLLFQSAVIVHGVGHINLCAGADTWRVQRPVGSGLNVEYRNELNVIPGTGNDRLEVTGLRAERNFVIFSHGGETNANLISMDVFGDLRFFGHDLADSLVVSATNVRGEFRAATFGGDDFVEFFGIARNAFVNSGGGNDHVRFTDSRVDQVFVQLGDGGDLLQLFGLLSVRIDAFGGGGNDLFATRNVRAVDAYFDGQAGFDTYREFLAFPNDIANLRLVSIERRETI